MKSSSAMTSPEESGRAASSSFTAAPRFRLLRKRIWKAFFRTRILASSKPARRRPTTFSPRTVCCQSMMENGGTSRLVALPPRMRAIRPMRTNWCTAQLAEMTARSSTST